MIFSKENNCRQPILEIKQLSIQNPSTKKVLVHELDLTIRAGEMIGLVGESGSGKSITASAVMGLLPKPLEISHGEILLQGERVDHYSPKQYRLIRGKKLAMVFQDYNGSLTPFVKIGKQLVEVIRIHKDITKKEAKGLALEVLQRVNLPGEQVFESYPLQLSGGQKQRVAIAMAMIHRPALLIADEPTTALDVITAESTLELIYELCQESNCAVLFITHQLREVLNRADRIAVMYGGYKLEDAVAKTIKTQPKHPFTDLLLKSLPSLGIHQKSLAIIPGEPGNVALKGCPFVHRCPQKHDSCLETRSELMELNANHCVACHLYKDFDEVSSI